MQVFHFLYQVYSALKKHAFRRKSRVWNIQKDQNVTFLALFCKKEKLVLVFRRMSFNAKCVFTRKVFLLVKGASDAEKSTDVHRDKAVKMNIAVDMYKSGYVPTSLVSLVLVKHNTKSIHLYYWHKHGLSSWLSTEETSLLLSTLKLQQAVVLEMTASLTNQKWSTLN